MKRLGYTQALSPRPVTLIPLCVRSTGLGNKGNCTGRLETHSTAPVII